MKPDWIKNLKVDDEVWQIEHSNLMPGGLWKWKAKIVSITDSYIETEYSRDRNLPWLIELCKKLSPIHRTYERVWEKNYFDCDGNVNIEPIE